MKRRDFLQTTAGLSALNLTLAGAMATTQLERASTPSPGILDIGNRKQLFLDDWLIEETSRISRFMCRPQKHLDNPIIQADRPWEMGIGKDYFTGVQIFGQAVVYDEEERIFKTWYVPRSMEEGMHWCYAVSSDGYQWEKPDLGIFEFRGSKKNNILADFRDPVYFNVFKDPHDPDPQRRYKALGEQEGPIFNQTGGAAVAFSPDGLHWKEWPGNPVVRHGPNLGDAPPSWAGTTCAGSTSSTRDRGTPRPTRSADPVSTATSGSWATRKATTSSSGRPPGSCWRLIG